MKRLICLLFAVLMLFTGCGCQGVILDENESVVGNGTARVEKNGEIYEISNGEITKDGEALYSVENVKRDELFALGEYLYVNTDDGVVQMKTDGTMKKKTWSGEVKAAKGRWIYYQSENNKQETMTLYKIDMIEGGQLMLFADAMTEVYEIENNVFYFKGESGNEYINELSSDDGMFYADWMSEEATEEETE